MPGLDSYTTLLLHCDGADASIVFTDSSASAHAMTRFGDAQIDTAQSKFGGASGLFDGTGDFLSTSGGSYPNDFFFGIGDFTIDFWMKSSQATGTYNGMVSSFSNIGFPWRVGNRFASQGNLTFSYLNGTWRDICTGVNVNDNVWHHIAVVRASGVFYIFIDGVLAAANYAHVGENVGIANIGCYIGYNATDGTYYNGWLDEVRISKGIARWVNNFTPPTSAYNALSPTTVTKIFQTRLYTNLMAVNNYFTDLRTVYNSIKLFDTSLYTKLFDSVIFNTDLRVRATAIDEIVLGILDDFVVKLDGVELEDVDYNSLIINYNLNTTPSNAQFTLARRHDNLDKTLDNNISIITEENKIEVFDGIKKLFTGYVSEINADSTDDTVKITASDCRLKMSRASMELKYGGAWLIDTNQNGIPDVDDETDDEAWGVPTYTKFEKNIDTAFLEVMSAVSAIISGYDTLPFSGSFIPEYVKVEKDYTALIDELIRQTANCNWYIDENERLRFQKIGSGEIKSLPLASLTAKRHPYDLIVDNIQLNKISSNYTKSLIIKPGKNILQQYATRIFRGWINSDFNTFLQTLKEKTTFVFHQRGDGSFTMTDPTTGNGPYYTGINGLAISYYNILEGGWVSYPTIIVQWINKTSSLNIPDILVGSGSPTKTLHFTSYGKKVSNTHFGEEIRIFSNPNATMGEISPTPNKSYLCYITDENYDYTTFLTDLANFELNQNNKLITAADISLLLDAHKYYNLSFSDLINLLSFITIKPRAMAVIPNPTNAIFSVFLTLQFFNLDYFDRL